MLSHSGNPPGSASTPPSLASSAAQVAEEEHGIWVGVELGGHRPAHVTDRTARRDHQAQRSDDLLIESPAVLPSGAHRQAVLANWNRNPELRTEFHADRSYGVVEGGILGVFTTGAHPVGGQLHLADRTDIGRGDIGDGLGNRHASRCGRIDEGQRRAFTHRHGTAGISFE